MNMADQVIVSPNRDAINPELILKITLNVQRYLEIPLDISGILLTEDNKKLADISSKKFENVTKFDINAKTDFQERYTQQEISVILTTNLNEKMLDYIENIRYKNDKGDVNLKLTSRITYLFNKTQISHLYPKNILLPTIETPNKPEKMEILTHQNSQQASSRYTDLWIISGDSNQTMAEVNIFEATKNVKIPASDWVHDYCPVFGIGIFFVFNLPVIESFPKLPVTPSTTA